MNDCISTYVVDWFSVDFMLLRFNSSSLTCSNRALAAIIPQLVAIECQKFHMVDSAILLLSLTSNKEMPFLFSTNKDPARVPLQQKVVKDICRLNSSTHLQS